MIKTILVKIYLKLISAFRNFKWICQARHERKNIPFNSDIKQNFDGRLLILLPHVDDEWMCSSKLLLSDKEIVLCDMDMPGGDIEELHQERKAELANVSNITGKNVVCVGQNKVESLAEIITDYHPQYIFIPFFKDWHDEHLEVIDILKHTLKSLPSNEMNFKLACYQVSVPIHPYYITHALALSNREWKEKWKLFRQLYPSQTCIAYNRFALQEYVNGSIINAKAAEVFSVHEISEWKEMYARIYPSKEEKESLRQNLTGISSIRETVKKYI